MAQWWTELLGLENDAGAASGPLAAAPIGWGAYPLGVALAVVAAPVVVANAAVVVVAEWADAQVVAVGLSALLTLFAVLSFIWPILGTRWRRRISRVTRLPLDETDRAARLARLASRFWFLGASIGLNVLCLSESIRNNEAVLSLVVMLTAFALVSLVTMPRLRKLLGEPERPVVFVQRLWARAVDLVLPAIVIAAVWAVVYCSYGDRAWCSALYIVTAYTVLAGYEIRQRPGGGTWGKSRYGVMIIDTRELAQRKYPQPVSAQRDTRAAVLAISIAVPAGLIVDVILDAWREASGPAVSSLTGSGTWVLVFSGLAAMVLVMATIFHRGGQGIHDIQAETIVIDRHRRDQILG